MVKWRSCPASNGMFRVRVLVEAVKSQESRDKSPEPEDACDFAASLALDSGLSTSGRASRWAPGARREVTLFVAIGFAVLVIGNASTATEGDGKSPDSSVTYPIRFENSTSGAPQTAAPRPTVSYPVKLDMPALRRSAPTPRRPN